MTEKELVESHYGQSGLIQKIEQGLIELGHTTDDLDPKILAPVDEFHVGGPAATKALMSGLGLGEGMRVLDVGCGVGGPARTCAETSGARVTGVDLTESYIEAARAMTAWVGLDELVTFECLSVQDLAAEPGSFDAAYLMHVGMNVADKTELFRAIAAVLRPGAAFGIYDLMLSDPGRETGRDLAFPVPWASTAEMSFVAGQPDYESSLAAAGFELVSATDQSELGRGFVEMARALSANRAGPPPLGLHLLMGPEIGTKAANLAAALDDGILSPVELIARLG